MKFENNSRANVGSSVISLHSALIPFRQFLNIIDVRLILMLQLPSLILFCFSVRKNLPFSGIFTPFSHVEGHNNNFGLKMQNLEILELSKLFGVFVKTVLA